MNGLVSVVVPVYNVAAYLPECLQSILAQDHEKLEVILIDDGSTDGSGALCDEFAARDNRVRVIHQKNGGAAAAKNAGLRAATGEYLSFVDSDDVLEPGAYSHMIGLLEEYSADVVQCAYQDVYRNRTVERITRPGRSVYEAAAYLVQYTKDWTCGILWDKLYVRAIFDGIFFEEGRKIDDEYFTYQGIMNASRVVCDDRIVYHYRKRRSGVMLSPSSGRQIVLDRIDYLSKRRKNVTARYPALRKAFDDHFLDMMVILYRDPMGSEDSIRQIRQHLQDYFREKGHTRANYRLWPALIRLWLGLAQPPADQNSAPNEASDNFFD